MLKRLDTGKETGISQRRTSKAISIPVIIALLPHYFETEATNYLNVNFHLTPTSPSQAFPSLHGRKGITGDLEILTTAEIA